jgi:hypothetical protein
MASLRRAHQVLKMRLPSVGEWAATSPHFKQVSNEIISKERVPPLLFVGCHLKRVPPLQEGRTSQCPCAHIF